VDSKRQVLLFYFFKTSDAFDAYYSYLMQAILDTLLNSYFVFFMIAYDVINT